jgi:hypothetical protein
MPQRPLKRTAQSITGDIELDFGRYELRRPKSFGHAHHTYYQIACILAVLGKHQAVFEWLELLAVFSETSRPEESAWFQ